MYPAQTKANWLAGQDVDQIGLHTDFPGLIGSNEVTGGTPAYARKAVTFAAPSGGQRLLAGVPFAFDVPACTIKWISLWKSAVFVGAAPNGGGTPKNFSVSSGVVYSTAHGWADAQKIVFFGAPPAGLTEGTTYFTRDTTTDSFKVAATSGGAAIAFTGSASYGCSVIAIVEDVYASQGTHNLTASVIAVPD